MLAGMVSTQHGTTTDPRPTVDIYARLSRNPDGRLEKIDDQLADCRAVAERYGWGVGAEHVDNSLSAWKRGVRRPGWEALLDRLERGETAGVLVWHQDRLMRQPRDLERLLELADARGVKLASAHGSRDLSNPDDRFILRVEVAHACRSSDDSSRRIRRRFASMRQSGAMAGGQRPFGFPGRDRTTKRPVPDEQVDRERIALRQASEQVAAGLPLARVVKDWNAAGLRSAAGSTWTAITLRNLLLRPRNAHRIEDDGVLVGRMDGEPPVPEETFDRLRAVFASRRRGRVAGERYLASGILRCGLCGHPLSGRPHTGSYRDGEKRRQYCCQAARGGCGKVAADVRRVDEVLRSLALDRLRDVRHVEKIARVRADAVERVAEIDAELREARNTQDGLGERLGRGELALSTFDRAMEPLGRRMARLAAERDSLTGGMPDAVPQVDPDEIAKRWDDADLAEQRALLRQALGRDRLVLDPAGRTGPRTFDRARVRVILTDRPEGQR